MTNYTLPVDYDSLTSTERKQVREQYIKEQKGKCFYCGGNLLDGPVGPASTSWINPRQFPKSMFKYPVHLDHDHITGYTRGAVHARCNAYMWQYEGR